MDRQVCISPYLKGDSSGAGQLGMSASLPTTLPAVPDIPNHPVGPEMSGPYTELPGYSLSYNSGLVFNNGPRPAYFLLIVARLGWTAVASNPNVTQIRDRLTYNIDGASPDPDTSDTYLSQFTVGVDLSTNKSAVPLPGVLTRRSAASFHEELIGPVPPGSYVEWKYRVTAWTPPPYANNANNNSVQTSARISGGRIFIMTLPEPDRG